MQKKIKPEEVERLREDLIKIRRDAISVVRQVEALLELPEHLRIIKPKPGMPIVDKKGDQG